jgi:putative ABC transport system permease protein
MKMPGAPDNRPNLPGSGMLRAFSRLVPASHRDDWLAEWNAEVAHAWLSERGDQEDHDRIAWRLRTRCAGAVLDALWLRRHTTTSTRRTSMLAHDIRYATRSLARKPAFTAVVVGTLALCIGANTAIFSVVNSVLLHGVPYAQRDRLVAVWSNNTLEQRDRYQVSVGDYRDLRARTRTLRQLAASFPDWNANYTAPDVAERVDIAVVSGNFLSMLGAAPMLGRTFDDRDDAPGAPRTVILSHAFWSSHFHDDASVVGRTMTLDGQPNTIIGVMRPTFVFPGASFDLLGSFPTIEEYFNRRGVHLVSLIGRLRDGATVDDARRELTGIAAQLEREHPKEDAGLGATVIPLESALLGDVRRPILVLFGAVCAVLLIGCANVANLMLARAATRSQELAVRVAIGADPGVIARQLLTESALVAAVAGALGAAVAVAATAALARMMPPSIDRIATVHVDGTVLAFTLLASVVAAIVCGFAPALHGARGATGGALKSSSRSGYSRHRRRFQGALVVVELALSLVLAASAGLLINSFVRLANTNAGFRADHLVKAKLSLAGPRYASADARRRFFADVLEGTRRLPGVRSVGAVNRFPLGDSNLTTDVFVEGGSDAPSDLLGADLRSAAGDYFGTMGIPVVSGRVFTSTERVDSGAHPVIVINHEAAKRLFGNANPIGKRIRLGGNAGPFFDVIGVVGDIHDASFREGPRPQVYTSAQQTASGGLTIVIRYGGTSGAAVSGLRGVVKSIDPMMPVAVVRTIDEILSASSVNDRFTTLLLSAFSMLALLLAAVGTYGVVAFGVTERRREIGVRMALGARSGSVLAMVLREGLVLLALAVPIAALGVWGASRSLRGLLFGVSVLDPTTMSLAAATLIVATLLACYVPARRAARVDPLIAMRGSD